MLSDPTGFPADGLLGLALGTWGADEPTNFLPKVAAQLDAPLMTEWAGAHVPPTGGTIEAAITLGAFDSQHCDSRTLQVVQQRQEDNYWDFVFDVDSVSIAHYERDNSYPVVTNLGSPALHLHPNDESFVFELLHAYYNWDLRLRLVDCAAVRSAPTITIRIGGVAFNIPAANYILDLDLLSGECALAVEEPDISDAMVLGLPFLSAFCATTDFQQHTIEFREALKQE
ncbi:Peptidase A1 domain-containing protein [Aphelenchoides fujianensis]|nr:Peptidase A1 domain-containing protein [Aphelenchoides fujianensis]